MTNVILIAMPSVPVYRPQLGISLLKAQLTRRGVAADIRYLNLLWARRCFDAVVGPVDSYEDLRGKVSSRMADLLLQRNENGILVEEWIFAEALHGNGRLNADEYINELLPGEYSPDEIAIILSLRKLVPAFLDQCFRAVAWERYTVAGFTSTFSQHIASLALARRVKERHPNITIVFGGANCEGPMGMALIRHFPFVDYAASGEADESFPALVAAIEQGEPNPVVPGIISRINGEPTLTSPAAPVTDMDALPVPAYEDFLEQYSDQPYAHLTGVRFPLEQSRGCWWGMRTHCTFCGLNGQTMAFRAKSPARAKQDVLELRDRYGAQSIDFTDNIFHLGYFQTLLPELAILDHGVELFFEIKANVKKWQLELLRKAGMTAVQPGIESFSTPVLRLMGKGCDALQNIQCLKWCLQFGILAKWNLLYGFPGEDPADYGTMLSTLKAITHFPPPYALSPIRMDRFSPNFNQFAARGFCDVRPLRPYFHLYPLSAAELNELAYHFDFQYADGRDPDSYIWPIKEFVDLWTAQDTGGIMVHVALERGGGVIEDTRFTRVQPWFELSELENRLYVMCDEAKSFGQIASDLLPGETGAARSILESFVLNRLMVREGERFLSLAPTLTPESNPENYDRAANLLAIRT